MPTYRDALPTDADAHALLVEYFAERAAGFPAAQGAYRPTFPADASFTPPAGVFLLVEGDDEASAPVGCGGVRRIEPSPEGRVRYEVKHLWLRPEARGHGAGRRLLAELEARAIAFGAEELVLDTNASLEAAGGLYRSSGYAAIAPYNDNPNATDWYGKPVG
ncbi:GNAT family N-acetyltransferase [Agromyces sp. MMS24-K17]|uniref:GNAT family N-acetyltransferase n=1 Tax=Agromyces sp. MMS24-K17 TaxID=3372850 RepID=UPI003754EA7B